MLLIFLLLLLIICISFYIKKGAKEDYQKFYPLYDRKLSEKHEAYADRPNFMRISLKLGQMKLLLNELEFYTLKGKKEQIVVYAGSAPGHHQNILVDLFPQWKFIFYDPREFNEELTKKKNIEIHQEYFTDEVAKALVKKYGEKKILFLSDIRTGTVSEHENEVQVNMNQQYDWCKIMLPQWAMLKFRLPWLKNKHIKYFDGEIYTQPYVGSNSTETRLITDCKKEVVYNNDLYNDRCFYYQKYNRNAFHEFDEEQEKISSNIIGMDHCHDCWSFLKIIDEYYQSNFSDKILEKKDKIKELSKLANKMLLTCVQTLNSPPHGLYKEEKDIFAKILQLKDKTEVYRKYLIVRSEALEDSSKKAVTKKNIKVISIEDQEYYHKILNKKFDFPLNKDQKFKLAFDLCKKETHYDLYLTDKIKEKEIVWLGEEEWGTHSSNSRKTFNVLLNFICNHGKEVKVIVIFIATQLNVIGKVAKLFPEKEFHLISSGMPLFYDEDIKNLTIYDKVPPLDFMVLAFKKSIISTIIFTTQKDSKAYDKKKAFEFNLEIQIKIMQAIKPKAFLSVIPRGTYEKYKFLKGKIFLGPWGRPDGGFLYIEGTNFEELIEYDLKKIFKQLFNFSICIRPQFHKNDVFQQGHLVDKCENGGIDYCWDCYCESKVWENYFVNYKNEKKDEKLYKIIASNMINFSDTFSLCSPPHGMLPLEKNIHKKIELLYYYSVFKQLVKLEAWNYVNKMANKYNASAFFYIEEFEGF